MLYIKLTSMSRNKNSKNESTASFTINFSVSHDIIHEYFEGLAKVERAKSKRIASQEKTWDNLQQVLTPLIASYLAQSDNTECCDEKCETSCDTQKKSKQARDSSDANHLADFLSSFVNAVNSVDEDEKLSEPASSKDSECEVSIDKNKSGNKIKIMLDHLNDGDSKEAIDRAISALQFIRDNKQPDDKSDSVGVCTGGVCEVNKSTSAPTSSASTEEDKYKPNFVILDDGNKLRPLKKVVKPKYQPDDSAVSPLTSLAPLFGLDKDSEQMKLVENLAGGLLGNSGLSSFGTFLSAAMEQQKKEKKKDEQKEEKVEEKKEDEKKEEEKKEEKKVEEKDVKDVKDIKE